jgi:hypothetical protein
MELSKFLQILLGPKLGISDNNQAILGCSMGMGKPVVNGPQV